MEDGDTATMATVRRDQTSASRCMGLVSVHGNRDRTSCGFISKKRRPDPQVLLRLRDTATTKTPEEPTTRSASDQLVTSTSPARRSESAPG